MFFQLVRVSFSTHNSKIFSSIYCSTKQNFLLEGQRSFFLSICRNHLFNTSYQNNKEVKSVADEIFDLKKTENIMKLQTIFQCTFNEASKTHEALQVPKANLADIITTVKWFESNNISLSAIRRIPNLLLRPLESIKEDVKLLEAVGWKISDESVFILDVKSKADIVEIVENIKWLKAQEATLPVIMDNIDVVLESTDHIQKNFTMLKAMEWNKTNDFLPLLVMSQKKFIKLRNRIKQRVYLLADKLSIVPHIVSKYCIKHTYVFSYSDDLINQKINILLKANVDPEKILRDLAVLSCNVNILNSRLELLKNNNIRHIMPWMLKCSDSVIERTIELRSKRGPVQNQLLDYLVKKLNLHGYTARVLLKKYKFLNQIDFVDLTNTMDLLLKKFTIEEITENIHLLNVPLSELKRRIIEAESLGMGNNVECFVEKENEFGKYLPKRNVKKS